MLQNLATTGEKTSDVNGAEPLHLEARSYPRAANATCSRANRSPETDAGTSPAVIRNKNNAGYLVSYS